MRRLPALALSGLLTLAAAWPAAAQQDAVALLRGAIEARYGAALGEGELHLSLTRHTPGDFELVETVNIDPASRRFAAILRGGDRRERVEGSFWTEVAVAVPSRRIAPGEIITEADLSLMPMRTDQLGQRSLTSMTDLVGMQAKRVLSPGRPVPASSITGEALVQRNKPVTLEYRSGPLLVTARGRALADGAKGDQVRVQNLDSNRTLTATVTGPGTVSAAD